MPEIPEMELYKNRLNALVKGQKVRQVLIYRDKSVNLPSEKFVRCVEGAVIEEVKRRGKYLIFDLDSENYLLAHMMLDGRLFYVSREERKTHQIFAGAKVTPDSDPIEELRAKIPRLPGKPSVVFIFNDEGLLFFCQLTLGYLHYLDEKSLRGKIASLGPEPLDPAFKEEDLTQLLDRKRGMVKPWLMNQENLAGVGNAYSNEALFKAGILPVRPVASLDEGEKKRLFNALREIMRESIDKGGDMEEPFMAEDHHTGGFIPHFKVYDRAGQPCLVCNSPVRREEVGGRNAFFCPECQH